MLKLNHPSGLVYVAWPSIATKCLKSKGKFIIRFISFSFVFFLSFFFSLKSKGYVIDLSSFFLTKVLYLDNTESISIHTQSKTREIKNWEITCYLLGLKGNNIWGAVIKSSSNERSAYSVLSKMASLIYKVILLIAVCVFWSLTSPS